MNRLYEIINYELTNCDAIRKVVEASGWMDVSLVEGLPYQIQISSERALTQI